MPLTVIGASREVPLSVRFDTGCDMTMVSEDVALGLSAAGGTPVSVMGSTAPGAGRFVAVTFRFPPDALSGLPEVAVSSIWVVATGRTHLALLSFQEVHARYSIGTDDTTMYFTNR